MGIGGCIIVFALGAILTFGVNWHISGMNVHVVGVILMFAGLLGVVTYAGVYRRRLPGGRRGRSEEMVEERRYYDGP
jgi:membrane protein implicated in regulation of membrane protease activity